MHASDGIELQAPYEVAVAASGGAAREREGPGSHGTSALEARARATWWKPWALVAVVASVVFGMFILAGMIAGESPTEQKHTTPTVTPRVRRIAFSSCTQKHVGYNPIWEQAIIPTAPDAWVWLGDMAYMDVATVDCNLKIDGKRVNEHHPECTCNVTFQNHPGKCMAGNLQNARRKMDDVVRSTGYGKFLDYMCPQHLEKGLFPPPGSDLTVCPFSIFGVYDDHDFAWNDGNGLQLANKNEVKQVFLDALGEPMSSNLRNGDRGIYSWHILNSELASYKVNLVLLDERYDRVPLPCHIHRDFCQSDRVTRPDEKAYCLNFIGDGTPEHPAACCNQDDVFNLDWCLKQASGASELFEAACVPESPFFGLEDLAVQPNGSLGRADFEVFEQTRVESPFCEVLGRKQRQWLEAVRKVNEAPVTLVASGSVLFGHGIFPGAAKHAPGRLRTNYCSGDDWDCYRPAQRNLLGTLGNLGGCVIVLTGDYHFADIKRIMPDEDAAYQKIYGIEGLKRPIYQVMASGMDLSTATGEYDTSCGESCCDWHADVVGLRGPGRRCWFYPSPNFGVIDLDWVERTISMKIMKGDGTGVAEGVEGGPLELTIAMDTCLEVESQESQDGE